MYDAATAGALWPRRLLVLMIAALTSALPVHAQESVVITDLTNAAEVGRAPAAVSEPTAETPATVSADRGQNDLPPDSTPNTSDPGLLEPPPPVTADEEAVLDPEPGVAPARQDPDADHLDPEQRRPAQPPEKANDEIAPDIHGSNIADPPPDPIAQPPAEDAAGQAATPDAEHAPQGDQPDPKAGATPRIIQLDGDEISPNIYDSDMHDLLPEAKEETPLQDAAGQAATPPDADAEPAALGDQPDPKAGSEPTPVQLDGDGISPNIYDSDMHDLLPEAKEETPLQDAAGQAAPPPTPTPSPLPWAINPTRRLAVSPRPSSSTAMGLVPTSTTAICTICCLKPKRKPRYRTRPPKMIEGRQLTAA